MVRFGPADEDSPFDDTRCAACSSEFGLGLNQVSRSTDLRELCQDCFNDLRVAYDQDRSFEQ